MTWNTLVALFHGWFINQVRSTFASLLAKIMERKKFVDVMHIHREERLMTWNRMSTKPSPLHRYVFALLAYGMERLVSRGVEPVRR